MKLPEPFIKGMWASLPLIPGFVPFGILTGISAIQAGMSPLTAQASSLLLMSGASQIVAASMMVDHNPAIMVILAHLIINLRYMIYSAGLSIHNLKFSRGTKVLAAHLLIDQTFALSHLHYESQDTTARDRTLYYFGTATPLWVGWQLFTAVGIIFGNVVPQSWEMDFAITLCFVSLLIPTIKNRPMLLAAVVGGAAAVPLSVIPYRAGLFIATFCGVAAGLGAEYGMRRARERTVTP